MNIKLHILHLTTLIARNDVKLGFLAILAMLQGTVTLQNPARTLEDITTLSILHLAIQKVEGSFMLPAPVAL